MLASALPTLVLGLEIIWVNILLSGDNALVIALACRNLPPRRRWQGMVLGAGVAVLLRVVFTLVVARLLGLPGLKLLGALALVWIAVRLVAGEDGPADDAAPAHHRLLSAVWAIAVADVVMSLDNVLAIAAVAHGDVALLVFGLAVSVPLIVAGAGLILLVLERLPVLIWLGGALLGWVAGSMAAGDPLVAPWLDAAWMSPGDGQGHGLAPLLSPERLVGIGGVVLVLLGAVLVRRSTAGEPGRDRASDVARHG